MTRRSKRCPRVCAESTSAGSASVSQAAPSRPKAAQANARQVAFGSRIRIRKPRSRLPGALDTAASSSIKGRRIQKRLPRPSSLSTPIAPPIKRVSSREMVVPRPVPPKRRVVDSSAWRKRSKSCGSLSGGMPIPVSTTSTSKCGPLCSASGGRTLRCTRTSPVGVNFTAFPIRLKRIWRNRSGSPINRGGTFGSTSAMSSSPAEYARIASASETSRTRLRGSKGIRSRTIRCASIFDKSRMSPISAPRISAELAIAWTQSRCSSSSRVPRKSSVMPTTPVKGVRSSCVMKARKSPLA